MVKLYDEGVFLVNGNNIVPESEATPDMNKDEAKKGTIAYSILKAHNTSDDMDKLKIKFDAMTSHDITFVGIIQTAKASGLEKFPIPYVLTNCHNSLCAVGGTINEDDHVFGLSAAKKYGGIYVPPHMAVIHQYMRETMAGCGRMILGSDSHTRYGALGTMAVGEGGGELVKQLLCDTYDIAYPGVVAIYLDGKPQSVQTVVISSQHSPEMSVGDRMKPEFVEAIVESIIKPVIPADMLVDTEFLINPTGRFVVGGPQGDCGLTGRKIIVDTYGGACPHGGGAFSGKDPTKVDRSAAYAARYVAKNIVAAGLARQCQIQVSYAIGVARPINVTVYTEGTGVIEDHLIEKLVQEHFDLRPKGIIEMLNLQRPIYSKTAAYGHFGRSEPEFSWEQTDKAALLRAAAGL